MFLKQYNYKPRTNSQSSGSDQPATNTTTASTENVSQTMTAAQAGRRRSSATEKFAGLNAVKRSSQDAAASERKAAWADQKVGNPGILGGMWQNFTKGSN